MSLKLSRINDVLYAIHQNIRGDLTGRTLADIAACSEPYLHRIFHQQMGETLHNYIRRIRLEQAANQLMFDPLRPVAEIADQCGYDSLSSFSRAFKQRFGVSPGRWRTADQDSESVPYLADSEIAEGYETISKLPLPDVELMELKPQMVAYVRHKGYGRSIRQAWQLLQAWAATENRPFSGQIGLHHSNPAWVPLHECRYVACLRIDKPLQRRGTVNSMVIPGGLHAVFRFQGKYGELLPWISKVLDQWLPQSGLRMKTTPAFVEYHKNHFLGSDQHFELSYYLPVSFY